MNIDGKNLALRVVVTIIGIPLVLVLLLTGTWGVVALAAVLSLLGAIEWADMTGLRKMPVRADGRHNCSRGRGVYPAGEPLEERHLAAISVMIWLCDTAAPLRGRCWDGTSRRLQ